jgi:hypothetical protein
MKEDSEINKSVPGTMKVDFNNARKQAMRYYDRLVEKLNYAVIKEGGRYGKPNGAMHDLVDLHGYVLIDSEDIRELLDDLRGVIGGIAMTYQPGEEDFKDVYSEVYSDEEDRMEIFYDPEIEEEK